MQIETRGDVLLVRKHKNTQLTSDIVIEEVDNDKNLITGEVLSEDCEHFTKGTTIIFGKYALYKLVLRGEDFYFISKEDVIAKCDYTEEV